MLSKGWDYNTFAEDMKDPDPDKPHQALFDLNQELEKGGFFSDESLQSLVFDAVLGQALDSIYSDVQGAAVKCIPTLVKKVNEMIVTSGVQKLTDKLSAGKKEHRDIAAISLKYVVEHIPQGYRDCIRTLSFLLVKLLKTATDDTKLDIMDVAHDLLKRFGASLSDEHASLQEVFISTLSSASTSVRKRSITCLAALCVHTSDQLFSDIMNGQVIAGIEKERGEHLRKYIQLCSTISRTAGQRVGRYIEKIMPLLIDNLDENKLDQIEDDNERNEVRENILQAFESLIQRCPFQMTAFIPNVIKACKEGMSYDPYYDYDDDEAAPEEDDCIDEDEYLDMLEAEADDDDDVSWKVRKASAKCLSALIQARHDCLSDVYIALCSKSARDIDLQQETPSDRRCLPERFKEREESVRVDILKVFHDLLAATQVASSHDTTIASGSSSFRLTDSRPEVKYLLEISDFIVDCLIKTIKDNSVKIKANCFVLLKLFTLVIGTHSEASLDKYLHLIKETLSAKETTSVLKTEVLQFLLPLIRTTMNSASSKGFVTELLPFILQCVDDKYYKITSEALRVCGEIAPVILRVTDAQSQVKLLFQSVYERLCTADIHQEVKDCAISTIGSVLAHGSSVLTAEEQTQAFKQLLVLLNSDFCRISVIKTLTVTQKVNMAPDVLSTFMTEICSFLRKSSRPLRQASLMALQILVRKGGTKALFQQMLKELSPLLTDQDLHLSHLAIELCEAILEVSSECSAIIESDAVMPGLLKLLQSPLLQGSALDSMEMLFYKLGPVSVMGYQSLLKAVLDSASKSGGDNKQVLMSVATVSARLTLSAAADLQAKTVDTYIANLNDANNEEARTLGLACLGEVGRFIDLSSNQRALAAVRERFSDPKEDIKILAAVALGKVVIGNAGALLPSLLEAIKSDDSNRYLNLKAMKEALQRSDATNDFDPLKKEYKTILNVCMEFAGSEDEGVRSVVAECTGKLAVLAPKDVTQGMVARVKEAGHLNSATSTIITAMKYAVSDCHFSYDNLESDLKFFLSFMSKAEGLTKEDNALNVKVRRAAVQLLTSAVHSRPDLIRTDLDSYLSALLAQTNVDNELVRSVNLGPFRHKVDDGLELRKSAFECIDILLDGYLQPNWLFESLSDYSPIIGQLVVGMQAAQGQDIQMLNFIMLGKMCRLSRAHSAILASYETLFADTLLHKVVQDSLNQLKRENVSVQDKDKQKDFLVSLSKMIESLKTIHESEENPHFVKFIQSKSDALKESVHAQHKN
eukprot:TRINITY_DN5236_c2_g3_i1.p1 TRINITY_DN5236_c2_g3~~TRINITY_DN5236_c2_g3_i1.p1  ORF type:complete len:1264 (+),score=301.89 TRINITY_DN5236_c2_g3_i1:66-3857(+)